MQNSAAIPQVSPVEEAARATLASQAAAAGQVVYTNPDTGVKHTYAAGDNVQLVGVAATRASQLGLYTVARVLTILPGGQAQLELFKPPGPNDPQVPEGDVGIGADTTVVAFVNPDGSDNIHPLANETSVASDMLLRNNVNAIACDSQPASNPWGCDSCDDSGRVFDESEWTATVDDAMSAITTPPGSSSLSAHSTPGSVFYTQFSCPSQLLRSGEAVSRPNPACRTVTIATVTNQDGTSRYNLIVIPDELVLQSAYIRTFNMPLSPEYFAAIRWSQNAQYQALRTAMLNQRIVCDEVDSSWLTTAVRQLLERGYRLSRVGVSP